MVFPVRLIGILNETFHAYESITTGKYLEDQISMVSIPPQPIIKQVMMVFYSTRAEVFIEMKRIGVYLEEKSV